MSTISATNIVFLTPFLRSFHQALDRFISSVKIASFYAVAALYYTSPAAFLGVLLPFFTPWRSKIRVCLGVIFLMGTIKGWFVWMGTHGGLGPYSLLVEGGFLWMFYRHARTSSQKLLWGTLAALLGFFLMKHTFSGIQPVLSLPSLVIKPNSTSYCLCFMPDSVVVSLFILYLCLFERASWPVWQRSFFVGGGTSLVLAGALLAPALWFQVVAFEPGVPAYFPLWLFKNVLWTSLSEEVFYRLFLQTFLTQTLMRYHLSWGWALVLTSAIFGLAHLPHHGYAAMACVAGLAYGWAYHRTRRLEACIIAHAVFNTLHVLLFTYPFAKPS